MPSDDRSDAPTLGDYAFEVKRLRSLLNETIDAHNEAMEEAHRLRQALRRAHDLLDAEHGHSTETWADRGWERWRDAR